MFRIHSMHRCSILTIIHILLFAILLLTSTSPHHPIHPTHAAPSSTPNQYVLMDLTSAHPLVSNLPGSTPLPKLIYGLLSDFSPAFPTSKNKDVELLALPIENEYGCTQPTLPARIRGRAPILLMARRSNCSWVMKATMAEKAGAYGLIVVNYPETEMVLMGHDVNDTNVNIPVFLISYEHGQPLIHASLGNQTSPNDLPRSQHGKQFLPPQTIVGVRVRMYAPSRYDTSLLIMLMIAVCTIAGGAYLGASNERYGWERMRAAGNSDDSNRGISSHDEHPGESTVPAQYLTSHQACGFIVCASMMLLLLYYFIAYLIYILLLLYMIGSLQAMTHLMTHFLRWLRPDESRTFTLPCCGIISLYAFISFITSIILIIVWFTIRRIDTSHLAWLLQDCFGIALLLVIQQSLRLPNIKVSSILLVSAFLYDIFWVFLSTLIFERSVMVAVATGNNGEVKEPIPMLLRLPSMNDDLGVNSHGTMLGLGDIALPGLFLSYLLRFDYIHATTSSFPYRSSYFILGLIGYTIGMIMTQFVLIMTRMGQPALLYLVPCTLGVIVIIAWRRGDLSTMWYGEPIDDEERKRQQGTSASSSSSSTTSINNGNTSTTSGGGILSGLKSSSKSGKYEKIGSSGSSHINQPDQDDLIHDDRIHENDDDEHDIEAELEAELAYNDDNERQRSSSSSSKPNRIQRESNKKSNSKIRESGVMMAPKFELGTDEDVEDDEKEMMDQL